MATGGDWEEGDVAGELELGGRVVGAEGAGAPLAVGASGAGVERVVVGAGAERLPPATGAAAGDWAMAGTRRARSKTRAGIMALVHFSISSLFLLVGVVKEKERRICLVFPFFLFLFLSCVLGWCNIDQRRQETMVCLYRQNI